MENFHKGKLAEVAACLYESVDSPYSREKHEALIKGDWSKIARSKIVPAEYDNATLFAYDYACHYFLKKLSFSGEVNRLHKEAIQQFRAVEARIHSVNGNLRYRPCQNGVEGILSYARRKISDILGPLSTGEFAEHCDWGPGATSSLKGRRSTVDQKILEPRLSVTRRALPYAQAYLENSLLWARARLRLDVDGPCSLLPGEFAIVEDGRFATVPKDAYRRRSIDIQPTLNLFLQKGVGKMIRRRLKRQGIDLDDQTKNQKLAQQAYDLSYATIDLEAASDSVSYELVQLLLPSDWFELMDRLRTHSINIDGESHRLAKFSAMGNGFTFELESLLFYALSWAVVRAEADDYASPIAVYGDDIIVASTHAKRLITVLSEVGFLVNNDKSFIEGPFYESCGKHFFKGRDVTPPIQKEEIDSAVSAVRCANRLWRWAYRLGTKYYLDDVARRAYSVAARHAETLHRSVPVIRQRRKVRPPLPTQPWWLEGDGGLIVNAPFHFDRNGIAQLSLYKARIASKDAYHGAIYGETLRKRNKPFVNGVEHKTATQLSNELDIQFDGIATYGKVSPRGEVVWKIDKQRVYCLSHEVPEWLD